MAPSTRRTFTAGPDGATVSESVRLAQSARARALSTQTEGLQLDRRRQQQQAQDAQTTAFYRGAGEFSTLGAEGGYRPRGNITSGGVATGQRVPANAGQVGGMPAPGGGDAEALLALQERTASVALERGPQVGTERPTPNLIDASDELTDVFPRYPQDRYFQTTTKQTWQWVSSDGVAAGYWDVAAPADLLPVGINTPAVEQYPALTCEAVRYRVEGFTITNRLADGTLGTTGAASLLLNGAAVTLGTTVMEQDDYLAVNMTTAGTGRMLVTIELRPI